MSNRSISSKSISVIVIGIALCLCTTWASASEGVFLLGNDALQLGRASSGVASPRSSYWSYMNPASMVDLGRRLDLNWYLVAPDVDFEPRGLIGNRFDGTLESNGLYNIYSFGAIWPLKTGVLGGGLFVPSGNGVDYPHSRNLLSRLVDNSDRRLTYQHMRLVLSYAYKFENEWAVGVSLQGSLSRFRTDHVTLGLCGPQAEDDWDEALGAGFGLGLYRKWERWAFGISYSSRHWTEPMHEYADLLRFTLDTPRVLQAGVAYKLTPRIELTADLKYLHWSDIHAYGMPLLSGGFGWRDQYGAKLGIEWKATDHWTFMGGYSHTCSPVTKEHVFMAGLVPVIVEGHATAGFTYAFNDHSEVHLVGVHALKNSLEDNGRGDIFSVLGKGTRLSASAESLVLGYSYKF